MRTLRIAIGTVALLLGAGSPAARAEQAGFDLHAAVRSASPGAVIDVPAGLYRGPLVIDRPLELRGRPGAVLDGAGQGDVVRITAPDVVLRGFIIQSTGSSLDRENSGIAVTAGRVRIEGNVLRDVLFGIYLKNAPDCAIIGNRIGGKALDVARRGDGIRLWYSPRCLIERNIVSDSRDVVMWFSEAIHLRHNTVTNGRYGLHFMYSRDNVLEDNHLEGNSVGAFLMYSRDLTLRRNLFLRNRGPSGYGLGLKDMDGVIAEDNLFLANRVGVYIDNSPQSVDVFNRFTRNAVAYNDIGMAFLPNVRRNLVAGNTFLDNVEQVAVIGTGTFAGNEFTVDGRGNFWSDYGGFDADEDGIGDMPYRAQSLFENLMDREPKLRLFLFSPAQQAIELAARAFPSITPQPKVTDTAPLMRPVELRIAALPPGPRWPLASTAAALLLATGVVVLLGRRSGSTKGTRMTAIEASAAAPPAEMVRVTDLVKRYGRFRAVDGLSFAIRRGEAVALWGPNGAGKTTAIKCILGLLRHRGTIEVNGHSLRSDGREVRRSLGYVPQELAFYDDWRVREMLAFCARLKGVSAARVARVLEIVGLTDHERKMVGALSGGMKQRLALAAGLLADPPLLVLDEITSNLDRAARSEFLALLRRQKEQGKTILFTSHRLEEVDALADRVLVLAAGQLEEDCTPERLVARLGMQTRLKLFMPEDQMPEAVRVLRYHGIPAGPNCRGIEVEVHPSRKGRPIEVLLRAGLAVDDFETIDEAQASPLPEQDASRMGDRS